MAAQLPPGLIRVVSASHTEVVPSDPADVIFERKRALYNFWKVHDTQSRAIQDASNIRCRQLFWRVWGNPRLSISLSQNTMMRLWMQCQQDFDLSPFQLQINDGTVSSFESASSLATQLAIRRPSKQSERSDSESSISPTQLVPASEGSENRAGGESNTAVAVGRAKRASSQTSTKPPLTRSTSGNDTNRKRSSITTTTARGKTRPSLPRKKSSQTAQAAETTKPRRSIIRSPRTSSDGVEGEMSRRNSKTLTQQISQSPEPVEADIAQRKISIFELPSVSSWQSVDSHPDPFTGPSKLFQEGPTSALVDKNFRERFVENQKQLRSTTNLVGMNRAMRKTGSVVRFADEVDVPEDIRKLKGVVTTSPLATRAASEGRPSKNEGQPQSWRQPLPHRDSTGSVAAVSDDSSDEFGAELPRTKSQLSLAIADLKRSKSSGEAGSLSSHAVTSPEIEQEQEALISGALTKKKTEEEEKLLAMGHKDGVTKAGGINMPKPLVVKGKGFELGSSYESPEETLF